MLSLPVGVSGGALGKTCVYFQDAAHVVHARIKASFSGHEGEFVDAHELDAKTVKKVPKKMIGRVLSQEERRRALLERLG
jgi:hypothetical protein